MVIVSLLARSITGFEWVDIGRSTLAIISLSCRDSTDHIDRHSLKPKDMHHAIKVLVPRPWRPVKQ